MLCPSEGALNCRVFWEFGFRTGRKKTDGGELKKMVGCETYTEFVLMKSPNLLVFIPGTAMKRED